MREVAARNAFYCGLASIVLPVFGWLGAWCLLGRVQRDNEASGWRRRLSYLLGFDAIVLGLLVTACVVASMRGDSQRMLAAHRQGQLPRIGVTPDFAPTSHGVRLDVVLHGSPAERAGLRRGDVVVAVDFEDVSTAAGLTEAIRASEPDREIALSIERAGEPLTLGVTPKLNVPPAGRWEVERHGCGSSGPNLFGLLTALLAATGLAFTWGGRKLLAPSGFGVATALALHQALAPLMQGELCERFGGYTRGGFLLVSGVAESLLVVLAIALWFAMRRKGLQLTPREQQPEARALGLGALFSFAVHVRWGFLFTSAYILSGTEIPRYPIEAILAVPVGVNEKIWFAFVVAVMAPIAEECLFRGVLLPALAQQMRPYFALAVSSALFGLVHAPSHGAMAIATVGLGGALGWVRLHTNGLRACIALHACINATALAIRWL